MTQLVRESPRPWRRLHASTYVVLLLAAAVLFLVNVPGQYVPHVGIADDRGPDSPLVTHRLEHGWPMTYLIRDDKFFVDRPGEVGYRSTAIWSFTEDFVSVNPFWMGADIVVAFCLLIAVVFVAEYWRRQRQRVWQLRMSDLLGVTAIAAVAVWYALTILRGYKQELTAMRNVGIGVDEDGLQVGYPDISVRSRGGPTWLRTAVGEHFPRVFDRLVYAELPELDVDGLKTFERLKAISVMDTGPQLPRLKELERLEAIRLEVASVYWPDIEAKELDRELSRFLPALAALPRLWFIQTEGDGLGDQALKAIGAFPHLRILHLRESRITDEGLAALAQCDTLEELYLEDGHVSAAGLIHLSRLPDLRTLSLARSWLSGAPWPDRTAVAELQRRMPRLKVIIHDENSSGE